MASIVQPQLEVSCSDIQKTQDYISLLDLINFPTAQHHELQTTSCHGLHGRESQ